MSDLAASSGENVYCKEKNARSHMTVGQSESEGTKKEFPTSASTSIGVEIQGFKI